MHFPARALHGGLLQDVLTPARLSLGVGVRVAQPLDPYLEQQLVLVEERRVPGILRLAARQRHPIAAVVGEQCIPLVKALFVDEPRLVVHEFGERLVIVCDLHHAFASAAIAATHARNCPRMETSLVPLCVPVKCCLSPSE